MHVPDKAIFLFRINLFCFVSCLTTSNTERCSV